MAGRCDALYINTLGEYTQVFLAVLSAEIENSGRLAVGSWQWAVGSGQLAVGSWQLAVGGWQLAVGSWQLAVGGWRLAVGGWQWAVETFLFFSSCNGFSIV